MSPEVYNFMTDAPVNIYDADGAAIQVNGFGQRFLNIGLHGAAPGKYTLKVDAGLALAEDKEQWGFFFTEIFRLADEVSLVGELNGDASFQLYPDAPAGIEVELGSAPPRAPEGFVNGGELQLIDADDGTVRLRIPVRLAP
jgi:hypothetical protein